MDDLRFTAIHIGEYNEGKVRDVLSYIEENYPDIRWVGCEKPTNLKTLMNHHIDMKTRKTTKMLMMSIMILLSS